MSTCYVHCIREAAIYFKKYPNEGEVEKICNSKMENGITRGSIEHIIMSLKRLSIFSSWFSGKIDLAKSEIFLLSNNETWLLVYWNKNKSKRGMISMTLISSKETKDMDFHTARQWLQEEKFSNGLILSLKSIGV